MIGRKKDWASAMQLSHRNIMTNEVSLQEGIAAHMNIMPTRKSSVR